MTEILPDSGLSSGDQPDGGRQDMLADELHHRVQNTLAVVLALARLTARSATTIEAFQVAFGDRIQAMARTNALLLRGRTQAVSVRAALEVELEPYGAEGVQIALQCEDLKIAKDAALSLSLLIHELATNAAKYGALSTPEGRLFIACAAGPIGGALTWREMTPGFAPSAARPGGGGSLLIERLARDLGGTSRIEMLEGGLNALITFRLSDRQA